MRRQLLLTILLCLMANAAYANDTAQPSFETASVEPATKKEDDSSWDTDFGRMTLQIAPDGSVTGNYPNYSGKIKGQVNKDGLIEAVWYQPSSKRTCETMQEGSAYWGRVQWKVLNGQYLRGGWAYCDDPLGSGGAWNGDKRSVGKSFAKFFSTLIGIAGRVAGSQLPGGVGGSLAGMALGHATSAASSAVENSVSQQGNSATTSESPDFPKRLRH